MLTTVQVRNDLKEIRYYYSMKELFDRSSKTVKPLAIVQKVERYNMQCKTLLQDSISFMCRCILTTIRKRFLPKNGNSPPTI